MHICTSACAHYSFATSIAVALGCALCFTLPPRLSCSICLLFVPLWASGLRAKSYVQPNLRDAAAVGGSNASGRQYSVFRRPPLAPRLYYEATHLPLILSTRNDGRQNHGPGTTYVEEVGKVQTSGLSRALHNYAVYAS